MNFRTFLEYNPLHIPMPAGGNTVGTHNDMATALFRSSAETGSESLGQEGGIGGLPSTDLALPVTVRDSTIQQVLNDKAQGTPRRTNGKSQKNLIIVIMNDGTKIHLTPWELNRIREKTGKKIKTPEQGEAPERLRITFQRNPDAGGAETSRIIDVE